MRKGFYTIVDTVAEDVGQPFIAIGDAVAVRQFNMLMASVPKHIHGDYELWHIADYNVEYPLSEISVMTLQKPRLVYKSRPQQEEVK